MSNKYLSEYINISMDILKGILPNNYMSLTQVYN